jgi:hypothetical protein
MLTTQSAVTFSAPFTLNNDIGELPAGTYDIEVDEVEFLAGENIGYRGVSTLLFVRGPGTIRTLTVEPDQIEAALREDAWKA